MNSVSNEKNILRKKHRQFRKSLSAAEKKQLDSMLFSSVISLPEYISAETILIYVSTDIEADTRALIDNALSSGKTVAVPKCVDGSCEMEFYRISSFDDLAVQSFSILEPITDRCAKLTDIPPHSVFIIPALSCDRHGYRLGYGRGYYDRYLAAHDVLTRICICYDMDIEDMLPHDKYDIASQIVVTENKVQRIF